MKALYLLSPLVFLFAACSFYYGDLVETAEARPDIVMEEIEYVRVRGGDHLVRFRADRAERWEDRRMMELWDFSFEQLEQGAESNAVEANAEGHAGAASVNLDSGNVSLKNGVRVNMESEDIIIITQALEWRDTERTLFSAARDTVDIERSDGTSFTGTGLSVNIRDRTWAFAGEVSGTYVEPEDEEEVDEEVSFDEADGEFNPYQLDLELDLDRNDENILASGGEVL
ncbi:MAG: LPS export ABC transporter periplasmic protein LptC [Treponema sp.]|nr:LPS export ABC transporter periplasmic protein LptC [Treponema sp.]